MQILGKTISEDIMKQSVACIYLLTVNTVGFKKNKETKKKSKTIVT